MKQNKVGILLGSLVALVIIFFAFIQPKITEYKNTQAAIKVETQNAHTYQSGIELIKQGDWKEAVGTFESMRSSFDSSMTPYKNIKELHDYAATKWLQATGDDISFLDKIPNDYSGDLASEILAYKAQLENKKTSETLATVYTPPAPSKPRIGMTANEVLATTWGTPKDKNKTTTAYGVSEQWVYSSNRYVYLKDGIVDAIQD